MIPRFTFWTLIVLIGLVPLPLGSNRAWAWSLLAVVTGALMVLTAASLAFGDPRRGVPWRSYRTVALCYLGLLAWFTIQASGWTPAALNDPVWDEAAAALNRPLQGAISADPGASVTTMMRFATYGCLFWLGMQWSSHDRIARRTIWIVIGIILGYALYGLAVQFSGSHMLLWFQKWSYWESVTSTFVNRNHFAAYAGMGLILTLALFIEEMQASVGGVSVLTLAGVFELSERITLRLGLMATMLIVLATALVLSSSRGGLLATAVGAVALLVTLAVSGRASPARLFRFALLLGAAAILVLALAGDWLVFRAQWTSANIAERAELYLTTIRAIADAPVLGYGLGTFENVFRTYRDTGLGANALAYDYAHNTFLEFTLEAGIPAFAVLMFMFFRITRVQLLGARTRHYNDILPAMGVAVTAQVAAQSLIDFSVQIPAIAATYFFVTGITYAQSLSHEVRGYAHPEPAEVVAAADQIRE